MKKKSKQKAANPRHYWIYKEFTDDRPTEYAKVFCTAATAQTKAEYAALQEGVDVVLILRGGADPENWQADDVVQRVEPRPFVEHGVQSVRRIKSRQFATRKVGETEIKLTELQVPQVHTGLGRFYSA